VERRLEHESGGARAFYAALSAPARVGIEATGHTRCFERILAELGHELWIGDPAEFRGVDGAQTEDGRERDGAHLLEFALSVSRASGGRRWRSAICGNWYGTGRSWCGSAMRWAISYTPWPWAKGCGRKSCSPNRR